MAEPLPHDGHSLTRAGVALVTYGDGNVGGDATGLFVRDRRVVRLLAVDVPNVRTELLCVTRIGAGTDRLLYGLFATGRDPIALLERERAIDELYRESYSVSSFVDDLAVTVEVRIGAGGATVYGLDQPEPTSAGTAWLDAALGAGDFDRRTEGDTHVLQNALAMGAGEVEQFGWSIEHGTQVPTTARTATLSSNDRRFDNTLRISQLDLEALEMVDPATGVAFIAAGAPHFLAAFGRDALIANLLSIAASPERALSTLKVLAHHQGTSHDRATLEEPGRIAHEVRVGDMGVFGIDAGTPYYASIDATPLFVILLETCWRWGIARDEIVELLPAARRAIDWCRNHVDDRGFVHSTVHGSGLGNHGWKDSFDSMVRADGSMVIGQTAPAEVQGYVYESLVALAILEEQLGDATRASELRIEATRFATRFNAHFRVDASAEVAMALDGDGVPLAVRGSNVGHLLASGIIDQPCAAKLADRLMSADEFSGWGVRTLAALEAAYKPFGYHTGTVWPHDNAMLLRGLVRRGLRSHARQLIDALLDLAEAGDGQLPELVSGLERDTSAPPVPYLASARPQAWAAAVPQQIATSLMGLEVDAWARTLSYESMLRPDEHIKIADLAIGQRRVTVEAMGTSVSVSGDIQDLQIIDRSSQS